jgi:peptidyl-prolyl cis-trans isomerase SurA
MLQDTLARVTFTGRVRKGEKASLARARAEAAARYVQGRGVAAARIGKAVQPTPTKEGGLQVAMVTGNPAAIEAEMNEKNPLSVQITQRIFQKGDNKLVDEVSAKGPGTYTVQKDGRYNAISIESILPPGPKTLAEARGQATSDYQTYLEKEWINEMRTARPVKVNEAEVNKLITK